MADSQLTAVQKLVAVCESALGVSARVWFQRYLQKTGPELARIRASDEVDLESLRLAPLLQSDGSFPTLHERAARRIAYQDARRQKNLEDILDQAIQGLARAPLPSEAAVDSDWSARFFSLAQDVSYAPMKKLWAAVLAWEVRRPGSFSLKTLDAIRCLSPAEADALNRMAPFVVNGQAVLRAPDVADVLRVDEFHALVDAGVVSGIPLAWEVPAPDARLALADLLVLFKGKEPMVLDAWRLTGVGTELIPLLAAKAPRSFVRWLLEEADARELRWSLHRMLSRDPLAWDPRPAKLHEI